MAGDKLEILVATRNKGKIRELENLLADLPFILRSLDEFEEIDDVEETGQTFAENAKLKARYYSLKTGKWALADDSGLEVEALENAPGVYSARYAGDDATDAEKIEKLLQELNLTGSSNRRARFVCAMAVTDESGEIKHLTEGVCEGKIAGEASGSNGFGYDPVFIPDGYTKTFGELSVELKQKISHRAKAVKKIISFLRGFTGV